jgi:acrylyl-CoA reductase (NADPH)
VLPFVLRGVSVLGVDSVETPIERRRELWSRLADDMRPPGLEDAITTEVSLGEVEPVLDSILRGELRGRTVVAVSS